MTPTTSLGGVSWSDADCICGRRQLSDADCDALVLEMEHDTPNATLGKAVKDVGRTAIQLFCPA